MFSQYKWVTTPPAINFNVGLTKAEQHFSNDTVQNIAIDHNLVSNLFYQARRTQQQNILFWPTRAKKQGISINLQSCNLNWAATVVEISLIELRFQEDKEIVSEGNNFSLTEKSVLYLQSLKLTHLYYEALEQAV